MDKSIDTEKHKSSVSVVVPAYNEEAILSRHLEKIVTYLGSLADKYHWELLIIDDGSTDRTGSIADEFAETRENVRVLHHPRNFGLGQALKFGFANSRGDYVITLDADLSYDVDHIGRLLDKIQETRAKIVLASPYMRGGSIRNVPTHRRILSVLGNRFLKIFVKGHFSTLTSMVRVYDGPFIRSLDLRSVGMDVMPETIYKGMILRAKIVETPGQLDWSPQNEVRRTRISSMRIARQMISTVLAGFIFRPFLFFILPGIFVGIFSAYVNFWMFVHFFEALGNVGSELTEHRFSRAFASAYRGFPHTFIIGFLSAMLTIQLLGLGLLALQSKQYFEDLFHLGSTRLRDIRRRKF